MVCINHINLKASSDYCIHSSRKKKRDNLKLKLQAEKGNLQVLKLRVNMKQN